jgi:hypothetical protein
MLHVVEIRYGDNASASVINAMQRWLATGGAQPATVRYSLFGLAAVLRVDFDVLAEAAHAHVLDHAHTQRAGGARICAASNRTRRRAACTAVLCRLIWSTHVNASRGQILLYDEHRDLMLPDEIKIVVHSGRLSSIRR